MRPLALPLVAIVAAASLGGCLQTFEDPHYLRIVNLDLAPERVLAQDVVLNVTTIIDNSGGGASEDVRLVAKAYSEDTGFLINETERDVGVIPKESTQTYSQTLKVPRTGSIRVDIYLYEGDQGGRSASISARNLAALEPEVLDTGLRIADVDFLVQNTTDPTRPTIRTDLYVTNEGDGPSEDLQVQVKAREVSTGLIADIVWVGTGVVAPGATIIQSVNATVPAEHNYVFEIVTWRGDAIVARTEGNVQLRPTFEKPKDTELVVTTPDLEQFRQPTFAPTSGTYATPTPAVPGFGAIAAIGAALAAALVILRRR